MKGQGGGAENRAIVIPKPGDLQIHTAERPMQVAVESLAGRGQQQVPRPGQTSTQEDGLWAGDDNRVGQCQAQHLGSFPVDLQSQIVAVPPKQDAVAYGRVVQRDQDGFWCDVEVAGGGDGKVFARGTVLYRILT